MIFLLDEIFDLIGEGDIGQEQSAVFLVVTILILVLISGIKTIGTLEANFKSRNPFFIEKSLKLY
jgi:hypothetical protein